MPSPLHGRPWFAKLSFHDGLKEEIAAVHSDFIVWLMPTVPDGICWLTPLSFDRTQCASSATGFANHGLTCLAINVMIACAIGVVYLSLSGSLALVNFGCSVSYGPARLRGCF